MYMYRRDGALLSGKLSTTLEWPVAQLQAHKGERQLKLDTLKFGSRGCLCTTPTRRSLVLSDCRRSDNRASRSCGSGVIGHITTERTSFVIQRGDTYIRARSWPKSSIFHVGLGDSEWHSISFPPAPPGIHSIFMYKGGHDTQCREIRYIELLDRRLKFHWFPICYLVCQLCEYLWYKLSLLFVQTEFSYIYIYICVTNY